LIIAGKIELIYVARHFGHCKMQHDYCDLSRARSFDDKGYKKEVIF
jgi:hypothetical protein